MKTIQKQLTYQIYNFKIKQMDEITFEPIYCNSCNNTDLTYNQSIMDSYCGNCGEWQGGEY